MKAMFVMLCAIALYAVAEEPLSVQERRKKEVAMSAMIGEQEALCDSMRMEIMRLRVSRSHAASDTFARSKTRAVDAKIKSVEARLLDAERLLGAMRAYYLAHKNQTDVLAAEELMQTDQ